MHVTGMRTGKNYTQLRTRTPVKCARAINGPRRTGDQVYVVKNNGWQLLL